MYKILGKKLYKMRNFIFNLHDIFPITGDLIEFGYRYLYYFKFTIEKIILNIRTRLKYGKLDHNKICWVNPQNIQYYVNPHTYNKWNINSRILNGDWDCSKTRFEDLREVKAIEQRFKEGKIWEKTELYHQYHDEFSRGIKWGFKNKEDIDKSLKGIDSLYNQIKKNGYKSKKEIYSHKNIYGKLVNLKIGKKFFDDITLAISREGHFIFVNGKHRLKIAQLLNIPKIPIIIVLRHKKWMEIRKNLISLSKNYQRGKLNYQLTHPDLQDIPFKNGDLCFNLIKENLTNSRGLLLDIESNLGYFCHKFEDEGFDCDSVEDNRICLYFLRKLKNAENKKFKIIHISIFDFNKDKELYFDVVLALTIFDNFLEKKDNYINLIEFLKRLRVKELFIGVPNYKKFRNRKFYQNYSLNQFLDLILENSCLNKVQFIGKIEDGRLLYKFTYKKF